MILKEKDRKNKITIRNAKKQIKGITLIALVVTVIVLLILAGVAINLTVGDNGLFRRAQNAADTYQEANEREAIELALAGMQIGSMQETGMTKTELENSLKEQFGDEVSVECNEDGSFLITIGKNQYYVGEEGETIDSSNMLKISTAEELKAFRDDVNSGNTYEGKVVLLTNDINLEGEEWEPIGYYPPENVDAPDAENNKPFKGIFDGCGYEIDNFTIDTTDKVQGLFGLVNNAKIANLGVGENVDISGGGVTGGVIGYIYNETKVYNCYSKASVKGNSSVGGVVGNSDKNNIVSNCYNSGSVVGNSNWVGGIVGQVNDESIVETSYNSGNIYGKADSVGGVVGKIYINCTVKDCYNIGEVTGDGNYIGGVVGNIQESSAENCYNIGVINGDNATEINSVIGIINKSTVNNCYTLEGQYSNEATGIKILSSDELKNSASLLGNKFKSNTTGINNNYYPILNWQ